VGCLEDALVREQIESYNQQLLEIEDEKRSLSYTVISEGWASPLKGFMREEQLLETLHFIPR
jgi:ATP sulfurylase